jgi:ATP-dependent DNA helicase PIF1
MTIIIMDLSHDQLEAVKNFNEGLNILITGPGGSGKSYLIRHLKNLATLSGKNMQVCAMTGCAAVLLQCKAKTVHSWGGLGIATGSVKDIVKRVSRSKHKKTVWKTTDILVIDEVSMMSKKMFDIIDDIARIVRGKKDLPFGGMQVILSGDFYQLPPVGYNDDPDSIAFCFESNRWNECISKKVELTTIYRQRDSCYKKILNQIRIGKITKSTIDILTKRVNIKIIEEIIPTILYPTRVHAEALNNKEYNKLSSVEEIVFELKIVDDTSNLKEEQKTNRKKCSYEYIETEINSLTNSMMADKLLKLKVGTRVMCIANIDQDSDLPIVNGSQGIVEGFSPIGPYPMVRFSNGAVKQINQHCWSSENIPGIGVSQIPLIYAWAITIHKSQGVTLDTAQIDVGSRIFEYGQTYVALSRVRDIEGLYLTDFNYKNIKVSKKVKKFYES